MVPSLGCYVAAVGTRLIDWQSTQCSEAQGAQRKLHQGLSHRHSVRLNPHAQHGQHYLRWHCQHYFHCHHGHCPHVPERYSSQVRNPRHTYYPLKQLSAQLRWYVSPVRRLVLGKNSLRSFALLGSAGYLRPLRGK